MIHLTAKQKKQLAKKIRTGKNKCFPERGGGKRLAAMLDISPQLLTNWLAGTRYPSPIQLAKLARIFNVSMHELCSLPYSKRKAKTSDLIIAVTKYHERTQDEGVAVHKERKRLKAIYSMIYKELEGTMQ